jgi:hypothetical protein
MFYPPPESFILLSDDVRQFLTLVRCKSLESEKVHYLELRLFLVHTNKPTVVARPHPIMTCKRPDIP